MISKRIFKTSCDKEYLVKVASDYNIALKNSGFNVNIKFTLKPSQRGKHSRNILLFNPLFNSKVNTNIGKIFLLLLNKHFPKHHKYYKLFNKNNVKISYSCMQNMASVTENHHSNFLKDPAAPTPKMCFCRQKSHSPLAEKFLSECLVYHAQVIHSFIKFI